MAAALDINLVADHNLHRNIGPMSGPERIVICLDAHCINNEVKKTLKSFLDLKCLVNHHEIAFAVMTDNDVEWISDFQREYKNVIFSRLYLHRRTYDDYFDLAKLFRTVLTKSSPFREDLTSLRVIILYGRADCMPMMKNTEPLLSLHNEFPLFTLDVLYMPVYSRTNSQHVKREERMHAQDIFKAFMEICNSDSYILAADKTSDLSACVLKFLAHPAFRGSQKSDWFD